MLQILYLSVKANNPQTRKNRNECSCIVETLIKNEMFIRKSKTRKHVIKIDKTVFLFGANEQRKYVGSGTRSRKQV